MFQQLLRRHLNDACVGLINPLSHSACVRRLVFLRFQLAHVTHNQLALMLNIQQNACHALMKVTMNSLNGVICQHCALLCADSGHTVSHGAPVLSANPCSSMAAYVAYAAVLYHEICQDRPAMHASNAYLARCEPAAVTLFETYNRYM